MIITTNNDGIFINNDGIFINNDGFFINFISRIMH